MSFKSSFSASATSSCWSSISNLVAYGGVLGDDDGTNAGSCGISSDRSRVLSLRAAGGDAGPPLDPQTHWTPKLVKKHVSTTHCSW